METLNTLRDTAAPYTHWVMGHRSGVILGISIILVFETLAFIIYRWRYQKLAQDLEDALKRLAEPTTRPTYVAASTRSRGELPAIKGGMTYARNLGSALDRAYGPPPAPAPASLAAPLYRDSAAGVPGPWPRPPASGPYSNNPSGHTQPPAQPYPIVEPLPAPTVYPPAPAPAAPYHPPAPAAAPYHAPPHAAPYYPPPPAPAAAYVPRAPVAPPVELTPPPPSVAEPPVAEAPSGVTEALSSVVGKKATDRLKRWLPKVRIRAAERAAEPAAPIVPQEAPPESASSISAPVEVEAPVVDEAPPAELAPAEVEAAIEPAPEMLPAAAPEPLPVAAEPALEPPQLETQTEPVTWPAEPEAVLAPAAVEEPTPALEAAPSAPVEAPPEEALAVSAAADLADVDSAPVASESAAEPAFEETGTADGTPTGDELSAEDSAKTILLIEDDEKVAQYYTMLFEARGYRVSIANDGIAGVDLATRLRPGLILLDVMMPRQNGMMVLQTLRATPATEETPIVILSNFTEPTLIQRALQLGAVEYVVKTQVKAEALANAVPKWMQREKAFA